ncbi:serine hydrolase FSH [Absidia repens]|uniref:Serine hydrolase FSH n=1 Tax=Absidia repens TaxID=90262 RepID=A0A1X2IAH6_9FUNG|nr:serine hydrolase FSH [Absidia repens]
MNRKLRILCLHGLAQNATVFKKKTTSIHKKLNKVADVVFVTGPHLSVHPDHTSEALREVAVDPTAPEEAKPFGWWIYTDDQPPDDDRLIGFEESINSVKDVLLKQGPFDGVFGFSQGASFASMLTAMMENRSLRPDLISSDFAHPPFRFMMVAASFIPPQPSATKLFALKIKTPSLHMIGERDVLVTPDEMEALAAGFENPHFVRHPQGHVVPSNAASRNEIVAFVSKFCFDACSSPGGE